MKYHEKQVNKNLNQLEKIILVFIFIFSGLISALIINSGQPVDGWSDMFWFLVLAFLVGIPACVLPFCILFFLYNALGIRDIYNLGYGDGITDTIHDKKER